MRGFGFDGLSREHLTSTFARPVVGGSGKPVYSLPQIITQLTTSWPGAVGTTETWRGASSISFSIPATAPNYSSYEAPGFKPMTPGQVQAARAAFQLWDDLIAPKLVETTSPTAQITFAYSSKTEGGGTYTYDITGAPVGRDYPLKAARVWMNSTWTTHDTDADMYLGGYGVLTYIHEIGHALGLSHPGLYDAGSGQAITYAADAKYVQDTRQFTVMSYFDADAGGASVDHYGSDGHWKYAQTPLLDDIAAIQAKYGADMTTRTGDTTYGFHSNAGRDVFDFTKNKDPIVAIWDAGGNDTLDASGYSTNQHLSLVAGSFSDVGYMTKNVAIAFGATIENAVGGAGNDRIDGNEVANLLRGMAGNDTLSGGAGDDTLDGGPGADSLDGGTGFDTATYANATASVGIDLLKGVNTGEALGDKFVSIEKFVLSPFADTFQAGAAAVSVFGGAGADKLHGGAGADVLDGGTGDDQLWGGAGADVFHFSGAVGHDLVQDFVHGVDKLQFQGVATVHAFSDLHLITSATHWAEITWGDGSDITLTGVALAQLTASDFLFG